jgi:hypothetical protein
MNESIIKAITGDVTWKQKALHEALDKGYEIRVFKNEEPVLLKDGEVAFSDNGIIGILKLREGKLQAILKAEKKN